MSVPMRLLERYALHVAIVATVATVVVASLYGARAVGGSDSSGYLTQAYLWLDGTLHVAQPLSAEAPWPHPRESFTPLGYKAGPGATAVPIYAPGLPMIMAVAIRVVGDCAPYFLPAAFGGLLVFSTFLVGRDASGTAGVGALAAVLMATSPAFLFSVMTPMSDVPAAALWMAGFALLRRGGIGGALGAGLVFGAAVLVRPNLAPAAAAGIVAAFAWRREGDAGWPRVIAAALPIAGASVVVGLVNHRLYGSALESGYGPTRNLYALSYIGQNVSQFTSWTLSSEGAVLWPLALVAFLNPRSFMRRPRAQAVPVLIFGILIVCAYLAYIPFDAWWYLRLLLPAFPVLFIVSAWAVAALVGALRRPVAAQVVIVALLISAVFRAALSWNEAAALGRTEERYAAVGRFIDSGLPANAVFFSLLHSSSIRFYSGRTILRFDYLSPSRWPSAIEWLKARGYRPYLVLDGAEEHEFRRRFGGLPGEGFDAGFKIAEWSVAGRAAIYDLSEASGVGRPFRITSRRAVCTPPRRSLP